MSRNAGNFVQSSSLCRGRVLPPCQVAPRSYTLMCLERNDLRAPIDTERHAVESKPAPAPVDGGDADSWLGRNEFVLRRLHSLCGLIPVGAYMCIHLLTNASVLDGPKSFQTRVDQIHSLGSALPIIEWTFIFLPILFHAIIGVMILRGAQYNTGNYPYASNVRYTLQRATAWIAMFFIFYHVLHMHGWIKPLGKMVQGARFDPHAATSSAAEALQSSHWVVPAVVIQLFYAVGVLACVYHLANGLWTMGITWGVWTSPAAQRRANVACAVFGVALAAVGLGALGGMVTTDAKAAREVEKRLEYARRIEQGDVPLPADAEAPPEVTPQQAAGEALPPAADRAGL